MYAAKNGNNCKFLPYATSGTQPIEGGTTGSDSGGMTGFGGFYTAFTRRYKTATFNSNRINKIKRLGPSRAGALRKSGTGCCISVVKRIVGCSTIRGLMSSCISVFAVFRRGNVADLSVIDAVDVFTPPTPPSLVLVFWDAR
uniref:Uncharacterized protein n=1 Tax=Glossina austeni TaxID=7395 RepID=A0A1A9V943_GLOAU